MIAKKLKERVSRFEACYTKQIDLRDEDFDFRISKLHKMLYNLLRFEFSDTRYSRYGNDTEYQGYAKYKGYANLEIFHFIRKS